MYVPSMRGLKQTKAVIFKTPIKFTKSVTLAVEKLKAYILVY